MGDLRRALAEHAAGREQRVRSDARLWTDAGAPLDDDHLVAGAGLSSGARVWLAVDPPPRRPPAVAVEVSVDGGPDLAPATVLAAGTYRIGGTADDDVALLGAGLPAGAVTVTVGTDGVVAFDGRPVADGASVAVGPCSLRVRRLDVDADRVDATGGVPFNRTPYRPVPQRTRTFEPLPAPPTAPPPSRVAITSFLVPLVTGIGFALMLGRPQFLVISLLAPLVLIAVHRYERRQGRRSFRGDRTRYLALVDAEVDEVRVAVEEERVQRARALPPLARHLDEARTRRPSLWARGRDALLTVRLGTADVASNVAVSVESGGDDVLRRTAEARLEEAARVVAGAPVGLDVDRAAVVGFHGPADLVDGVVRSVLGQIVARHGPEDVVVAALLAPPALRSFEWLRWLPHVRSSASPVPGDHLAVWPDAVAELLGALLDVAVAGHDHPRLVVVVHEDAAVDRAALGRLLDAAAVTGVRVLWVGRDEALLPRQCTTVVRVAEGAARSLLSTTDASREPVAFTAEPAGPVDLDRLARSLAPLRDVTSVARVGSIPREVGLTDVLGGTPAPADVATSWSVSDAGYLTAPVGVGPEGTVTLDLVEQGPHALVAGTSGSGKSELLQSWLAALAALHPPERVTFLFVDYKGGAAAGPFADLPHNVGVVTNLDERMSRRALVSLRAELDRRMALLADRARDLTELAALDPVGCPPRLVLVVDEFATLVKEIPDFVAGVVDIAQRGRSLGIHLILATQRPAGVVNESILANTNLRIALRVVDAGDSQNILGTRDAADIPVPLRGRAFARLGPTELVPFQAAWSGAPRQSGEARKVRVEVLGFGRADATDDAGTTGTHLDDVLRAVRLAFERSGRTAPRRPWLPPLPDVVPLSSLDVDPAWGRDPGRFAVLGRRDDPGRQRQDAAVVDLEAEGGLAVFGVGGSGRTTALRTVAASVLGVDEVASPDEVVLVVFDFAGGSLRPLLELPHTRAVVTGDDLEGTAREIEWLAEQVALRRSLLADERVESLGALRTRDREPVVPRIVVLVDGMGALRADLDDPASFEWLEQFQRVLVEGRQVGVHAVVAADRRADVPTALLGAIAARLVLRMGEPDAMVGLGVPVALAKAGDLGAGRGFLRDDEEVQVAIVGDDAAAAAQTSALVEHAAAGGPPVSRPLVLPTMVERPTGVDHGLVVALGVAESGSGELEAAVVDLARGHLLVVGPPGSGRSTALAAVVAGLRASGEEVTILAGAPGAESPTGVLVIDDADRLSEADARAIEQLSVRPDVRIVAAVGTAAAGRSFTGLVATLKRDGRVLVLAPQGSAEIEQLTGVRLRLRPGTTFPPGRGVLVADRRTAILQIGLT